MKNLLSISLLLFFVATFFSCGFNQNDEGSVDDKGIGSEGEIKTVSESEAISHLTAQQFKDKVFNYEQSRDFKYIGTKPCLIDFYADWCPPCKKLAPILEELSKEYNGQIVVYKVNVDNEKELASIFNVQSIPTLLLVPVQGKPEVVQGLLPKDKLKEAIDIVLLKKE